MDEEPRTPLWVWSICVAVALTEPATHLALRYGLPDDVVFTGLHISDDSGFLPPMVMPTNGFFSPYVSCKHPGGPHDAAIFGAPVFWLLAILGLPGALLGLDPFLVLGVLNGVCGLIYLWAVYRFLCMVVPKQARVAFLIFSLGGGLGGVLYLVTGGLGLHDAAGFETAFHRYARYELIEGPFLSPALLLQRLYYTLPLALGYLALIRYLRAPNGSAMRRHAPALLLLLVMTYCNARLGPLFWVALVCHLAVDRDRPLQEQVQLAVCYAAPVLLAVAVVTLQMGLNPVTKASTFGLLRRSIWFGSLVSVACWHLLAAPPAVRRGLDGLPRWARAVACGGLGYLAAFSVLYAAHQIYYGNWLGGGDAAAAVAISDWALLGAVAGGTAGLFRPGRNDADTDARLSWMALWAIVLCAAGVAALGQGRLLALMPERTMVLLGVPLAVLSARGIELWAARRPRTARALLGAFLICGVCSIAVGASCFQGPLGFRPGRGPFQWLHTEVMTPAEAEAIDRIDGGMVLAPAGPSPLYGDIIVRRRPGTRTVFGQGTFAIGDVDMTGMGTVVRHFFSPDADEAYRRAFVEEWCVDYVFCPESHPIAPAVLAHLRGYAWLEAIGDGNRGAVFRVRPQD